MEYDSKDEEGENVGPVVAALCTEGKTMGTEGGVTNQRGLFTGLLGIIGESQWCLPMVFAHLDFKHLGG